MFVGPPHCMPSEARLVVVTGPPTSCHLQVLGHGLEVSDLPATHSLPEPRAAILVPAGERGSLSQPDEG